MRSQEVEERMFGRVGARPLINKGGRKAANVSTSLLRRAPSSHLPHAIGYTPAAVQASRKHPGSFENYFLLSPNGQLANSLTPFIAAHDLA
jgi:hypothetical protein